MPNSNDSFPPNVEKAMGGDAAEGKGSIQELEQEGYYRRELLNQQKVLNNLTRRFVWPLRVTAGATLAYALAYIYTNEIDIFVSLPLYSPVFHAYAYAWGIFKHDIIYASIYTWGILDCIPCAIHSLLDYAISKISAP